MEGTNAKLIDDLELMTQEYSVLIADSKRSFCGSGVLFYSGEEAAFYVFHARMCWMS